MRKALPLVLLIIALLGSSAAVAGCDCSAFYGPWVAVNNHSAVHLEVYKDCSTKVTVEGKEDPNVARVESLICLKNGRVISQFRMTEGSVDRDGKLLPYPHKPAVKKALEGTIRTGGGELFFGLMGVEDRFIRESKKFHRRVRR